MPIPGYTPQLAIAEITGRQRVDLVVDPDAVRAEIDLDALDRLFADGARTLLLTQPHNPWGRVFTRAELEGIRDVVRRHGARVVSDEIHAPLVLEGSPPHVPYLSLEGTADHAVAVVAGSKAFNTQGLSARRSSRRTRRPTRGSVTCPWPATTPGHRSAWSRPSPPTPSATTGSTRSAPGCPPSGTCSSTCSPSTFRRPGCGRSRRRTSPGSTSAPTATTTPPRSLLENGRVRLAPGHDYHPGLPGHVRLNIATSPDRLTEIVRRMGKALG